MKTAYIFHDAFCDPISDWYPWMKTTLEGMGYLVVVPKFPTPGGQSYESWKAVMKNNLDKFDTETIFVGHGIGGTFALRILEEIHVQIHGTFLVASYTEALGHVGYDRVNETFIKHEFNWEKIKNNTHVIKIFAGENDPFVHADATDHLADNLNTDPIIIPGGEHINKASGFTQCIQVAQGIKEGLGEIDKSMVIETVPETIIDSPEPTNFVRAADASFHSDTNVSEKSAPTEEKKFVGEVVNEIPTNVSHTMYQDMSRIMNSNEGRVASSLLKKARTDEQAKKINTVKNPMNGLYIAGTFAIILIILGVGAFVFTRLIPAQKNALAPAVISLLQSESHEKIDITSKQPYELLNSIQNAFAQAPDANTVTDIYYMRGGLRISFNDIADSLDITSIPESMRGEFIPAGVLNRPVFMHGVIQLDTTKAHFLILPVSHYDRAFAALKEWEPSMFHDLGPFMNIPDATLRAHLDKDVFSDELVNNKQVRTLRDSDKNLMLAYFFLNEHTIIIVDNLDEIPTILTRSANSQIYQ